MVDKIAETARKILSGGPSLREMHDFAMRDFLHEAIIRQHKAIEDVHAMGIYPHRVGCFIVKDKNTLTLSRPPPPYADQT